MMEIAILENLQRENLNAIEEALAYESLITHLSLTQEEVSKKVGKSRSHITNMLGLIKLPEKVKKLINENKISMGHARVLSKISDKDKIESLSQRIILENLSVRELEHLATTEEFPRTNTIIRKEKSKEYFDIEHKLAEYFGTRVRINNKKLEISFENEKDLNRILDMIDYQKD